MAHAPETGLHRFWRDILRRKVKYVGKWCRPVIGWRMRSRVKERETQEDWRETGFRGREDLR
jgi:hypothetical protein